MSYQQQVLLLRMVQALVTEAPLRERLRDAAIYVAPRMSEKFKDDSKLREIYHRLSHVEAGPDDDGTIDATIKRLTDEEANKLASDIVSLFFEACGGWRK